MSVKQEVVNFLFFLRLKTIIIHVDRKACAWTRDKITGNDFTRGLFNACISFLSIYRLARARLFTPLSHVQIHLFLLFFQYYEMSYGLNVEMHKQVSPSHRLHLNFKSVSSNRVDGYRQSCIHARLHAVSRAAGPQFFHSPVIINSS